MKKIITIAAVMLAAALTLGAQERNRQSNGEQRHMPSPEEMIKFETQRMVKELALDDATAAKFTPVYTEFRNDLNAAMKTAPKLPQNPTDAQIEESILAKFEISRQVLDIREAYYPEFRKILTPRQLQKIYDTERRMGMPGQGHGQQPGQGGMHGGHGPQGGHPSRPQAKNAK